MYKDNLDVLKNGSEVVHHYFHVAYADDHVTILALNVELGTSRETINALIETVVRTCRGLLAEATIAAGCGVNEAKSEVVLPPKYQLDSVVSKTELVWLGYSLKLTDDLAYVHRHENASQGEKVSRNGQIGVPIHQVRIC